jgi:AraC family transcriptional regulator
VLAHTDIASETRMITLASLHAALLDDVRCGGLAAWQVNRVRAYIEANLETPLKALDLATTTRLSVSHFSRAFRISFGQSPHAYVMIRRAERAKRLMLLDDPIPLAEIALRCGLSDQAHLSRLFRKIVGDSPATWRRRYWSPRAPVGLRLSA